MIMKSAMYLLLLFLLLVIYGSCKDCVTIDKCSCTFDDGSGTIDLTSLGTTDDTPRFKDIRSNYSYGHYSYNPCGPFQEGDCYNASVCMLNSDLEFQTQVGDAATASFSYDGYQGVPVVSYTAGTGGYWKSHVSLICDTNVCVPSFGIQGQPTRDYQVFLTLTSICACPGMCDSNGPLSSYCSGSENTSLCFINYPDFTKKCEGAFDGKEEAIKVLIINNWDGVCTFPNNDDVVLSLNDDRSTCEDVIHQCNPRQPFSVNGYVCKAA